MSGIHIAVGIIGAGLGIDASWVFVTTSRGSRCRIPGRLWLPLRLRLGLPLGLRLLPVLLGLLPLGLRLPLRLWLLPLRARIVQTLIITDREAGTVLRINTSRILGSWLMLWLGQRQSQAGGDQLEKNGSAQVRLVELMHTRTRAELTSLKNMLGD